MVKIWVAAKYQQNGEQKQEFVCLINFEQPENNHCVMVSPLSWRTKKVGADEQRNALLSL